jgi:hypothetical protein
MRKAVSLILLLTVFSQGCAGSGVSSSPSGAAPGSLAAANQVLTGQRAKIELDEGQVVRGAQEVRISPGLTSWRGGSEPGLHEVPTAKVLKVSLEPRRKTLRGLGYGILIGGMVAFLGGSEGDDDPYGYTDSFAGAVVLGSIVVGGLVGAGIGAARRSPEQVVYIAPGETN